MVFARIWHIVARKRRRPTSVQMFRRAQHLRDEARYKRAVLVVEDALLQDPRNVVGHLLAASLHMVLRETGQARASFERVLALEPTQPRALLGLARVALEEGDAAACLELLTGALTRYPDFPEARALLEVARGLVATADAKRTVRIERSDPCRPAAPAGREPRSAVHASRCDRALRRAALDRVPTRSPVAP